MGTVQKIAELSRSGRLSIIAKEFENQKGTYFWYFVSYDANLFEVSSEMPTLKGAIDSVYSQAKRQTANINASYLHWQTIVKGE